jgi:hypothetical protein
VHGTKLSAAFWTIRPATTNELINIEYDVHSPSRAMVVKARGKESVKSWLRADTGEVDLGGVVAKISKRTLSVTVANK